MSGLGERLDAAIAGAGPLLRRYFDPTGPFAGSTFDDLGDNARARIGADDLLALTLLDVSVPPAAVRTLLSGDLDSVIADIPDELDLWEAEDGDLAKATLAWEALRRLGGIDWVIASKFLARKRPRLVPILDSVVRDTLRPTPNHFWEELRAALTYQARRQQIEALRPPHARDASLLRLLDVAIWMRHSQSGNARRARADAGADA